MSKWEKIVRELASRPVPEDSELSGCLLCGSTKHFLEETINHEESCPWRMAVELVREENGTGGEERGTESSSHSS